ncbi:signal peptide protein [Rhodopirellula maiorica SM1]|uniref:Signal peptide protein n=1 Tax=Rhodopirellula maiorica SM1 TaxID=1265738 RepID=M5S8I2_9BACT|nr:hypothetical protein [Rhodopirellula maiorica]EMI22484.1 signal peptide protein [Rhodopirellula maiorica SM1]
MNQTINIVDSVVSQLHAARRMASRQFVGPFGVATRIWLGIVMVLGIVAAGGIGNAQSPTRLPSVKHPTRLPAVERPVEAAPVDSDTDSDSDSDSDTNMPITPEESVWVLPETEFLTDRFYQSLQTRVAQRPEHDSLPLAPEPMTSGLLEFPDPVLRSNPPVESDPSLFGNQLPFDSTTGAASDLSIDPTDECSSPAARDYSNDFSPTPIPNTSMYHDGQREQLPYDAKADVPTQYPLVQWGRQWYGDGITPKGIDCFGPTNLVRPKFYLYGDYRTGIASGRNAAGRTDNWASRLNLDMDLQLTDTDRLHGFVGPLDKNNQFTRWEKVGDDIKYRSEFDLTPVTGFYEGDLGVLMGASQSRTSPFELPFTIGLVPLLFQNGIWMEDAVTGAAFALPSGHSRLLNWSNFDATFFAIVDQINSAAFGSDEHAAQAFGTAWFIEAYDGYIETGYAYVRDRNQSERSYHNITASFTRRYFDRISNSVRVIVNSGQDLAKDDRTADGALLLVENSWITANPLTFVPYANFFYGWNRPQSVARAGGSGGILRNTGINFESDGLNGFATLDPTAADTAGGAVGVDLIADDLGHQWLLELAYVSPHGNGNPAVPADQFAAGTRYQMPLTNATLLRFDLMYGWRGELEDVYGTRMEYRWKF